MEQYSRGEGDKEWKFNLQRRFFVCFVMSIGKFLLSQIYFKLKFSWILSINNFEISKFHNLLKFCLKVEEISNFVTTFLSKNKKALFACHPHPNPCRLAEISRKTYLFETYICYAFPDCLAKRQRLSYTHENTWNDVKISNKILSMVKFIIFHFSFRLEIVSIGIICVLAVIRHVVQLWITIKSLAKYLPRTQHYCFELSFMSFFHFISGSGVACCFQFYGIRWSRLGKFFAFELLVEVIIKLWRFRVGGKAGGRRSLGEIAWTKSLAHFPVILGSFSSRQGFVAVAERDKALNFCHSK